MSSANASPLLTTKLIAPPLPTNLVLRPQLLARLDQSHLFSLTVLVAPAGFGKTTALSSWARQRAEQPRSQAHGSLGSVAWVSLDAGDNDPVQFWSYIFTALSQAAPDLAPTVEQLFATLQRATIDAVLAALINQLAVVPTPITLILDDYHQIETPAPHQGLLFLLDHLPPSLHLVLASRSDPPLPLARLRARGQLDEVRADVLRFNAEETAILFRTVTPLLAPADMAALSARTEGWAAGLQLATQALRRRSDPQGFVAAFTGSHRAVVDYLVDEVLQQQPSDMQRFLLQTSILDQLSAELCAAVVEPSATVSEVQRRLEQLERANMFLIPLDEERRWYRYHQLFGEFLRVLLQQAYAAELPELHRRAATWYEARGRVVEAIGHALATGDQAWAAEMVARAAQTLFVSGRAATVLRFLDALPGAMVRAHPTLAHARAWALLESGNIDTAVDWMQFLDSQPLGEVPTSGSEHDPNRLEREVLRAGIAAIQGRTTEALAQVQQVLSALPGENVFLRSQVSMIQGMAAWLAGDTVIAQQALAEANIATQATGNSFVAMILLGMLARLQEDQGQLNAATKTYQQVQALPHAVCGSQEVFAQVAAMKASRIYYERNQLAQARAVLEGGIAAARTMQLAHFLIDDYLALALVRQADGDGPGALAVLDEAERVLQQSRRSYWANWLIPNYRVQVLLAQGTLDQAARWMHEQAIAHNAMEPQALYIRELHDLTRARVAIALGQPEAALALLAPLLEQAVAGQRHGRVIAILALQAVALAQHGATEAALTATRRALVLAAPEGYVRAFIDVGPTMRLLLAQLRDQLVAEGSTPELSSYAAQLLAAFPHHPHAARAADTSDAAQPKAAAAMIEPLSNREREVLRFLVTGQSNQAIANALVITVGTLKVHLKNIYSKLGVHSRTEAVYRARQLALLGD